MLVKLSIEEMKALKSGAKVTLKILNKPGSRLIDAIVEGPPWSSTENWKELDMIQLIYRERDRQRTEDFRFTDISLYEA